MEADGWVADPVWPRCGLWRFLARFCGAAGSIGIPTHSVGSVAPTLEQSTGTVLCSSSAEQLSIILNCVAMCLSHVLYLLWEFGFVFFGSRSVCYINVLQPFPVDFFKMAFMKNHQIRRNRFNLCFCKNPLLKSKK